MSDFLRLPPGNTYRLTNLAKGSWLPGRRQYGDSDIFVKDGLISGPHDGTAIDLQGAIVLPSFTDMHTHLDKGHIWPRAPNPDGTFHSALSTVAADRIQNWHREDVRRRMEFALQCAFAHGTSSIRTHLDSASPQHQVSWPVFDELRSAWQGRIELQAVTILGIEDVDEHDDFRDIADTAAKFGGILGCVTYPMSDLDRRLDVFFAMAKERGMDADFHVDETCDPNSATLRSIAEAIVRNDFEGQVVAGHCCSLSMQPDKEAEATIALVSEAGLAVVSLPMCNLYLQDRKRGRTPRWRGVAPVHEMRAAGIQVSFASDNTRDPFYAYGDLDMIEVMREAFRICHLDHSEQEWIDAFTTVPAETCRFQASRLAAGDVADFVICNAGNIRQLMCRPQADRVVVRGGRAIDRALPDYSQLNDLMKERT